VRVALGAGRDAIIRQRLICRLSAGAAGNPHQSDPRTALRMTHCAAGAAMSRCLPKSARLG
jgi:hypothetical protein